MATEPYAWKLERSGLPAPDGKYLISPFGPFGPSFRVSRRGRLVYRVIRGTLLAGLTIGALVLYRLPDPQAKSIANYVLLVVAMWLGLGIINLIRARHAAKPGEPAPDLYAAANMAILPRWMFLVVMIPSLIFVVLFLFSTIVGIVLLKEPPDGATVGLIAAFAAGSFVMYRLWRGG